MSRALLAILALAAAAIGVLLWLSGRDLAEPEPDVETYTEHDGTTWTYTLVGHPDLVDSRWLSEVPGIDLQQQQLPGVDLDHPYPHPQRRSDA